MKRMDGAYCLVHVEPDEIPFVTNDVGSQVRASIRQLRDWGYVVVAQLPGGAVIMDTARIKQGPLDDGAMLRSTIGIVLTRGTQRYDLLDRKWRPYVTRHRWTGDPAD